ncbi:hypothetical protein BsWGS_06041 [Bradybaena similaris]
MAQSLLPAGGTLYLADGFLLIILFLWLVQVGSQDCKLPENLIFEIKETDPAGTELFNVSSSSRSNVFTYTAETWLTEFLNLTLNDTDLYYHMRLSKPLDLEEIYYNLSVTVISAFSFQLHCKFQTVTNQDYNIIVEAVNEWPPEFTTTSIHLSVNETLPIGSVVITLTQWSYDKDVYPVSREIVGYSLLSHTGDPQVDGHTWLDMSNAYDGIVVVKKGLDYEALPPDKKYLLLGVQVNDQGGKSATASLTVHVEDGDDLPPVFTYPGCWQPCRVTYSVSVSPDFVGLVSDIKPAPIEARDRDTLNYGIQYYIVHGPEHYEQYISIDKENAQMSILQALNETGLTTIVLIVEAREVSQNARSSSTALLVSVQDGNHETTVILSVVNAVIIVAVILCAVIVILGELLIVAIIYLKQSSETQVLPANSKTAIQDDTSGPNGVQHQTSTTSTNEEISAEETGPPTVLDRENPDNANVELSSTQDKTGHPDAPD